MSQYHTFTASDAVAYAQQFGGIDNPSELVSAQEVGDGNLNLVFKIFDTEGVSRIIVKQALPYVRCVGESWPLTLDRARLEAQTLVAHYQHCPQHTVRIVHFDPELAVMVMEDLSDHRIWRGELINNVYYPQAASQLGNTWPRRCSTPATFICILTRKRPRWRNLLIPRCAKSPRICSLTTRIRFTSATAIQPRWKPMSPPCATMPS
jgi:S-methyl-5-thioribose kinase